MKKAILLACSLICLVLSACKKEKRYSTWTVNNESFSYNDIEVAIGKAECGLASKDVSNRFSLSFSIGFGLPKSGTFELRTFTPGRICGLTFYYHGQFYYHTPSQSGTLYASSVDNKASYTLPPSWFVNYDNPTSDSVLIQGTFNEP